jgi:hypothetical protein
MPGNRWKFLDGLDKILNVDLIDVAVDIFDLGKSLYKHFVETWGNKVFFEAEVMEKSENLDGEWNGMRREFEGLKVFD